MEIHAANDEGRRHKANRVIDQKVEKNPVTITIAVKRSMRAPDGKSSGEFEKPRDPQLRDNDHHAQQKRDGVEIDGFEGFSEAQSPERDHQACADERDANTIDP
jgi:hypothetical protein